MNRFSSGRGFLQRREGEGGDGGGGGGGEAAWYEALPGIKENAQLVEGLKPFKTPVEAFSAMSRGFGDQWRETMVSHVPEAERQAALEWANRYKTPKDFFDASRQAHSKARAGETAKAPHDKSTPEEVKAYREAHGIPETPEGYLENLPNGLVIGEDDREILAGFAKDMHALHAPPAVIHAAYRWYNKFQETTLQERQAADTEDRKAAEDALRQDFGADYRANLSVMTSFLESLPDGVAETLKGARGPDGKALFNSPEVVRALVGIAREMVPGGTLMGATSAASAGLDTEIAELEKRMRTNPKDWAKDLKAKARLESLYDARERRDARKSGTKAA